MPLHPHELRKTVVIPVLPAAPRQAREAVEAYADLQELEDVGFIARLLAGELASNVLRHAGLTPDETFELRIACDGRLIHVEAIDRGPGFDPLAVLARHSASTNGFRGISLVDSLADRWGYRRGHQFRIWFEIDLIPGRRPWNGREPMH